MQQYRNSIRSVRMIKKSFLEILKTKEISKITIKEVADLADLSRNTFYAHFLDVYEVNNAIEDDVINKTLEYLDLALDGDIRENSLNFFRSIMLNVDKEKSMFRALLKNGTASTFVEKYSSRLIDHVLKHTGLTRIKDVDGFTLFLNVLFSGSVYVIRQYLNGDLDLTSDEIAYKLNNIFLSSHLTYLRSGI